MEMHRKAIDRLRRDFLLEPKLQYAFVNSWFINMASIDQTSPYHREGDVLTHTYMVVCELDKILKEKFGFVDYKINPIHKALLFAAWFHDIGKVECKEWNESKQRNTFNGHSAVSARKWREFYTHFEIDPLFGEHVFELIKSHDVPTNYSKQNTLDSTYRHLAARVCPHFLYILALADMRGRIADDQQEVIKLVESFCTKCEELGCSKWNRFEQLRFNSLSDFSYLSKNKRCLLLPIGVPGCGKSHLLNDLIQFFPTTAVICPDSIRAELYGEDWHLNYGQVDNQKIFGIASQRLRKAAKDSEIQFVYFDAQNLSTRDRKTNIEIASKSNLAVVCFWFRTKLETILAQNRNRSRIVPEEYIKKAFGFLQLPIEAEADYIVTLSPR